MDAPSTEQAQQLLKVFTWRGFGLAWDGDEQPVETRQIVAAATQQQAMSISAEWMIYSFMVESFPPESQDPEHLAVAMRTPSAIFWARSGVAEWQELTRQTPRVPPSARGPIKPVVFPVKDDPEDKATIQRIRDALFAAETAVTGTAKVQVMDGLIALAGIEERMRMMRGTAGPFLALAQDRMARKSYEPIPVEACGLFLAAHHQQPNTGEKP